MRLNFNRKSERFSFSQNKKGVVIPISFSLVSNLTGFVIFKIIILATSRYYNNFGGGRYRQHPRGAEPAPPPPRERLLICSDGIEGGVLNRKIGPKSRFGATVFLGVKPLFANRKNIFQRASLQPSRSPTQHVVASPWHPLMAEHLKSAWRIAASWRDGGFSGWRQFP
jgi:hypothetical protein